MKLTLSLELTLGLFMLCSVAAHHLRVFLLPEEGDTQWSDEKCNQTDESFVTLYDEEDAEFTKSFLDPKKTNPEYNTYWLGLRKVRNTTWSNGKPVTFDNSSVNVTNGQQLCVAIEKNSSWIGFNCAEKKPFMCAKANSTFTLFQSNKTWCQALKHCRTRGSELVSIHNEEDNRRAIANGSESSFWIGLMHDEWEWMDNGCSSFRDWTGQGDKSAQNEYTLVDFNRTPPLLAEFHDGNVAHSFCSKGLMRIKVIKEPLTWERAFDYCKENHAGLVWIEDGKDQEAVQQWLNETQVEGPFWIGLRQSRVFGFWIWSDRMVNYNNWRNGEQPEPSVSNLCGVINKDDYRWSNENCWIPQRFLCEEEIVKMDG